MRPFDRRVCHNAAGLTFHTRRRITGKLNPKSRFQGRRDARSARNDLRAQAGGSGASGAFLTNPAVPSGERARLLGCPAPVFPQDSATLLGCESADNPSILRLRKPKHLRYSPAHMIDREMLREWYTSLGRHGGSAISEAKARAARRNGRKGGRPRRRSAILGWLSDEGVAKTPASPRGKRRNGTAGGWQRSGAGSDIECWAFASTEAPSKPAKVSLSEILQRNVPHEYSLTASECEGILRRAEARGKKLPRQLAWALREAAGLSRASAQLRELICIKGAAIGRAPEAGPQYGEILADGSCYTLNTTEQHAIAFSEKRSRKLVVRRLTPVECERLQGLPDNYTRVPWKDRPASECPDEPRYRALGNSMAVPCLAHIGGRIQKFLGKKQRSRLKYISGFSGIGAACVAFRSLGWEPLGFSEIEPFPTEVLRVRYPTVRNFGDMRKHDWSQHKGKCDLVVGGPPCQSFSMAGLRRSLDDERGNLTLHYAKAVQAIRPRWVVAENVPGWLSADDNAFGHFLAALVGANIPLRPLGERGRWPSSGVVSGLLYGAAWRVLDARHFGVPQGRRRVFVVAHLGDWRPAAAVLFEREASRFTHRS
jgi:site-specific DNA-cytosine methylase